MARPPTEAEQLARFVAELRYEALPDAVLADVRRHILDVLGVMVVTESRGTGVQGLEVAEQLGGPEQATAVGAPTKLSAPNAALANGMLAHALDYDDSHSGSVTHPSAVIVPAALAAAELSRSREAACLTAAVAGYEVVARVGAVAGSRFMDRGFHSTALAGAFGAAAASGKLLGLSEAAIVSALGLAGSQAAGILEFLADGTDAKQLHAGWAAHCGLFAALLAGRGLTGPASVLEGRFGLYQSHLDGAVSARGLGADLGTRWATSEVTYKPYPACHLTHTSIDALLSLMREPEVSKGEIARIHCEVPDFYVSKVLEPHAHKLEPRTSYEAKFSLPFCLASTVVHGSPSVKSFDLAALRDPEVLQLAAKVTYEVAEFDEFPAHYPGAVTVALEDGQTLRRVERHNRRLAQAELLEKFHQNCDDRLGREETACAADRVLQMGGTGGLVTDLMASFRFDAQAEVLP